MLLLFFHPVTTNHSNLNQTPGPLSMSILIFWSKNILPKMELYSLIMRWWFRLLIFYLIRWLSSKWFLTQVKPRKRNLLHQALNNLLKFKASATRGMLFSNSPMKIKELIKHLGSILRSTLNTFRLMQHQDQTEFTWTNKKSSIKKKYLITKIQEVHMSSPQSGDHQHHRSTVS